MPYVVPKGSIAVDGISLTVAQIRGESFAAAVVPHTEEVTTLKDKPIGAPVNIEADMMAKYVERFVDVYAGGGRRESDAPRKRARRHAARLRGRAGETHDATPAWLAASTPFASIEEGIAEIAAGRMLIVVDDEDRENEGDLVMAAEKVTPEAINFMVTHGRGLDLPADDGRAARRSSASRRWPTRTRPRRARRSTCSIGAKGKITTGISAADRATTVLAAIDPRHAARGHLDARATSSRCARGPAACSSARVTPRRPSTSRGSPA